MIVYRWINLNQSKLSVSGNIHGMRSNELWIYNSINATNHCPLPITHSIDYVNKQNDILDMKNKAISKKIIITPSLSAVVFHSSYISVFFITLGNPIRSGVFQADTYRSGGALKAPPPPPTISKTIVLIFIWLIFTTYLPAKLCNTEHQSCQEPETLLVGHFLKKSRKTFVKWAKCFFLVYLNVLSQSIVITDSMLNFGNFFTKKRYNFWSNRDRKKKRYLAGMKFCCASNAAIKNVKIARTKSPFFQKV